MKLHIGELLHNFASGIKDLFNNHKYDAVKDSLQLALIANEVRNDVKGMTGDQLTKGVLESIHARCGELPPSLKGEKLDESLAALAQAILDLPIDEVKELIKKHMS